MEIIVLCLEKTLESDLFRNLQQQRILVFREGCFSVL